MSGKSDKSPRRPNGMLAFAEFASTDPSATRQFLERVFDWKFESAKIPTGEYLTYRTPGGGTGGIRPTLPKEPPVSTNYIVVDDLDQAERRVRDSGGEIVLPQTDIPKMGSFFWFKVPGGPIMACWKDAPDATQRR